jgi:hypothetical protein
MGRGGNRRAAEKLTAGAEAQTHFLDDLSARLKSSSSQENYASLELAAAADFTR